MKKKFVIIAVLGTLIIGCVTALYAMTGEQRDAAELLDGNRKSVRDHGLPISLAEVYPNETVLETNNSAPLIIIASELISEDAETALETLLTAGTKTSCAFDWEQAQEPGFVDSLKVLDAIALLISSASDDFATDNEDRAITKILTAERIASHLASIPTPEALAESARAEREMIVSLGGILRNYPKNQALLAIAQEIGKRTRPIGVLQRCLRSMVVAGSASAEYFDGMLEKMKQGYPADPWGTDAVESRHLEGWLALYIGLEEIDDWPAASKYLDDITEEWSKDERPSSYSLRTTDTEFVEAAQLAAENVALRRILFVAVAALENSRIHDQFNAKMPVQGILALDPFRGEQLQYSTLGTGFKIYSWGHDRLDNGGTSGQGFTFEDGDIGFRYSPSAQTDD